MITTMNAALSQPVSRCPCAECSPTIPAPPASTEVIAESVGGAGSTLFVPSGWRT